MYALGGVDVRRKRASRPVTDLGTPERQAQRIALVGSPIDPRAEYPLGVLLARGIIDQAMHDAGLKYGGAVRAHVGRTGYRQAKGEQFINDDAAAAIETSWRSCCAALLNLGRRAKDAVDNAVVYERLPGWLMRDQPRPSDERERLALMLGLNALAEMLLQRRARLD